MLRRAPSGLFHLAWVACALLALRPLPAADEVAERVLAPARMLGRVFTPLERLAGGTAHARSVRSMAAEGFGARVAEDLVYASLPSPELRDGRRCVPARVLRRPAGRRDDLVLEPWTLVGVEVGQPVAMGDAYLGRVQSIDERSGRVTVRLVTARGFFVGARLEGEGEEPGGPVRLVVGGVALGPRPEGGGEARLRLAAHHPSLPSGASAAGGRALDGALVVDEYLPELDPFHDLSRGLRLGRLVRGASEGDWHVEPMVDFLHGLYQVVVLTGPGAPLVQPPAHALFEPRWARAHLASPGDATPARAGVSLWLEGGAVPPVGAAVVADGRLVGRVTGATALGVDAALLADAGLALPVAAVPLEVERGDGTFAPVVDDRPRVLGRVVSLGLDRASGRVALHLRDAVPLELEGVAPGTRVRLRLVTGSGEVGLPSAVLVGEAVLPTGWSGGRGRRLLLDAPSDPLRGAGPLFVRLSEDAPGARDASSAAIGGRVEAR